MIASDWVQSAKLAVPIIGGCRYRTLRDRRDDRGWPEADMRGIDRPRVPNGRTGVGPVLLYNIAMLLEPMLARLAAALDLDTALSVGLRDFVALHGAEMGDVQFVGADGSLVIVEARGLSPEFLAVFRRVFLDSGSACGRAARDRKPVFIQDVAADPEYAPYSAFAATVPFSSVLSCPMFRPDGEVLGMISALSSQRFSPTKLELEAASAYAAALARSTWNRLRKEDAAAFAERKSSELVGTA